jgi:hypothetical protein
MPGKKLYIYSTLTNSQKYTKWSKPAEAGALPAVVHEVVVHGGANLSTGTKSAPYFHTPRGVMTPIDESDLAILKENEEFQNHVKRGFISVRDDIVDPEVAVAAAMKQQDRSAPFTPNSPEMQKPETEDQTELKVVSNKAKSA